MSYSKEELAKKEALKDLARSIIGDTALYTIEELGRMKAAVKSNEEGCVEFELYHLADTWKEVGEELVV